MTEDMFFAGAFFFTAIVLGLGIPLVRAWTRRRDQSTPQLQAVTAERIARMEIALETMALEIERISEGQRFVTRLLSERAKAPSALPPGRS